MLIPSSLVPFPNIPILGTGDTQSQGEVDWVITCYEQDFCPGKKLRASLIYREHSIPTEE